MNIAANSYSIGATPISPDRLGRLLSRGYQIGDKVAYKGITGTLTDYDAVGSDSTARILIDGSSITLWDCEWIDITRNDGAEPRLTPFHKE